jgi:hypothetical protein
MFCNAAKIHKYLHFLFGSFVRECHATNRRAGAFFAVKWSFFETEQGQACLLLPIKYFVVV